MTSKSASTFFRMPEIGQTTNDVTNTCERYFSHDGVEENDYLLDIEKHQGGYHDSDKSNNSTCGRLHSYPLWRKTLLTFYLVLFPMLAFAIGWLIADRLENAMYHFVAKSSDSIDELVFDIGNSYGSTSLKTTYGVDYPWSFIVEPYKVSYFSLTTAEIQKLNSKSTRQSREVSSDYIYRWIWDGTTELGFGQNISVSVPGPAGVEHTLTVQVLKNTAGISSNVVVREITQPVVVKYVRREIRQLLAQDRVAFLQAVSVLQRVPTSVGQRLYGSKYYSRDYFNRLHLYFGGSKDCDRMHEGPGFISAHMGMTLMFEQALQAVNPSVSLPFWDFTLEATFSRAEFFRSSIVFSDGWFSEANTTASNPAKDRIPASHADHVVRRGRFAMTPVMQHAENYSMFVNSYGMLRAPWNANPYPYLTRATTSYDLPSDLRPSGCAEYATTVGKKDFVSAAMALNTDAHGHIHELIGGSWGFRKSLPLVTSQVKSQSQAVYQFSHFAEKYSKLLWRASYLECPNPQSNPDLASTCQPIQDVSRTAARARDDSNGDWPESCRCQCVGDIATKNDEDLARLLYSLGILRDLTWYDADVRQRTISQFLNSQLSGPALPIDGYTMSESLQIYRTVREYICDIGMIGDMFQGTSTNDVIFWVLHPNMERLWHAQRLASQYNLIAFDENWAESDASWSCLGHKSTDPTFLKNIFDSRNVVNSNQEVYESIHPARLELPYVYDQMTFPHCEAQGYNMKGF
jgi:hypothetical protein